jgi:hypothetical protein
VPRRLLLLNAVLLAASVLLVTLMVRTARTPWPAADPPRPRAAVVPSEPATDPGSPTASAPTGYAVVAARNLFSPTRTETPPPPPVAAAPAVALPKPNLYGVIVREDVSIAYLEDPVTKRVGSYKLGDAIAGGTVQAISRDRVTLSRPDGNVDVRLHDPSRPRPPAPPPAGGATPPALTPPAGGPAAPATPRAGTPPLAAPAAPAPSAEAPANPRRTLPPSFLRRLPPSPPQGDAPQQ